MGNPRLHRLPRRLTRIGLAGGLGLLLLAAARAAGGSFNDSFDDGLAAWQPVVADNWEIAQEADGNDYLKLRRPGKLREGVRRPGEYALVAGRRWQDVTITARVMSLRPTTLKGRDVVLVFGWQDDTHFYYAHLCNDSNGKTHNVIVKVHGDGRTPIQVERRPEPRLTDGWHTARVVHRSDGSLQVFMNDLETPLMTAQDTDYPAGAVGVGSFDDVAAFDDVTVTGTEVAAE